MFSGFQPLLHSWKNKVLYISIYGNLRDRYCTCLDSWNKRVMSRNIRDTYCICLGSWNNRVNRSIKDMIGSVPVLTAETKRLCMETSGIRIVPVLTVQNAGLCIETSGIHIVPVLTVEAIRLCIEQLGYDIASYLYWQLRQKGYEWKHHG